MYWKILFLILLFYSSFLLASKPKSNENVSKTYIEDIVPFKFLTNNIEFGLGGFHPTGPDLLDTNQKVKINSEEVSLSIELTTAWLAKQLGSAAIKWGGTKVLDKIFSDNPNISLNDLVHMLKVEIENSFRDILEEFHLKQLEDNFNSTLILMNQYNVSPQRHRLLEADISSNRLIVSLSRYKSINFDLYLSAVWLRVAVLQTFYNETFSNEDKKVAIDFIQSQVDYFNGKLNQIKENNKKRFSTLRVGWKSVPRDGIVKYLIFEGVKEVEIIGICFYQNDRCANELVEKREESVKDYKAMVINITERPIQEIINTFIVCLEELDKEE